MKLCNLDGWMDGGKKAVHARTRTRRLLTFVGVLYEIPDTGAKVLLLLPPRIES